MAEQSAGVLEDNWFAARRRQAGYDWGMAKAQNDYEKRTAKTQYDWDVADLAEQYARARTKLPGSFARRGMLNSGVYERALGDFNKDKFKATSRAADAYATRQEGFGIAGRQIDAVKQNALNEIQWQKDAYLKARSAVVGGNY